MSVTFHLYRVRDDVDYLGSPYDNKEERTDKNDDSYYVPRYSDGIIHTIIDYGYAKAMCTKRDMHRMLKPIRDLNYKLFDNKQLGTVKYVVVDEVLYRQGWFLKKKFFDRKTTVIWCNSKEQMARFFDEYIDYNSKDKRGRECVRVFLNAYEPGMLFECAF